MARVRWTGDGDREVMVEVDGEVVQLNAARMVWVDVPQDVALNLNRQAGWELEAVKKAQRTRAKNEAGE